MTKKKGRKTTPSALSKTKNTPSDLIKAQAAEGISEAVRDLPGEVKKLVLAKVTDAIDFNGRDAWRDDDDEVVDTVGTLLKKRATELAKEALKGVKLGSLKVPKKVWEELRKEYKEKFFETLREQVEEMAKKQATELAERLVKKELTGLDEAKIDFNKELDIHDPECDSCMRVAVLENALMSEFGPKALGQLFVSFGDGKRKVR
jgi:hypothetical protein